MKMKCFLFSSLLLAAASSASAQVPTMMSYQGRLAANGSNYNGTARFKFSLVSPDGFTTYWSNDNSATGGREPTTDVAVAVSNGLFTVFLGDTTLPGMGAELGHIVGPDMPGWPQLSEQIGKHVANVGSPEPSQRHCRMSSAADLAGDVESQ